MGPHLPRWLPPASTPPPFRSARLQGQVRERIRHDHCSLKTRKSHVHWVRRFVQFHGLRHPKEVGRGAVEAFLARQAHAQQVSPSMHHEALCALLSLASSAAGLASPLDALRCKDPRSTRLQ